VVWCSQDAIASTGGVRLAVEALVAHPAAVTTVQELGLGLLKILAQGSPSRSAAIAAAGGIDVAAAALVAHPQSSRVQQFALGLLQTLAATSDEGATEATSASAGEDVVGQRRETMPHSEL
jgi:hypothetical protein